MTKSLTSTKKNIITMAILALLSVGTTTNCNTLVTASTISTHKAKAHTKARKSKKRTKKSHKVTVTKAQIAVNENDNTIVLPSGYTWKAVDKANDGATSSLDYQSSQGMKMNHFHSESAADDNSKIDPYDVLHLSNDQSNEINNYILRLLNSVRQQAGVSTLISNTKTQKLAFDIADEYEKNNHSILDQAHYVVGIVKAAKENGLNIDNNYIEDMGGDNRYAITNMTSLKKIIYWNLCQMLFGGATSEDGQINPGTEYEHAVNLLNPDNKTVGIATDYTSCDGYYSTHIIVVSKDVISFSKSHGGTWK